MPSKLGPHLSFVRESDAMMDFLLTARPAVCKCLNPDATFWAEVKAQAPEIFLFGRKYFNPQPWDDPGRVAGAIRDMSAAHIMDAWEGLNEPSRQNLGMACNLDYHVAQILHREGIKYVAGSWSVGVPDIEDWTKSIMLEALRVADYIGVHEYSASTMNFPLGMCPDGTGWFTLRFLKWYPTLPDDCRKPLLITECGIDSGAVHWNPGAQGGWRSFCDAPTYMQQLAWYDSVLQQHPYVKGATIYQWGSLDPTWDSHDWTPELQVLLRNYIVAQRDAPGPPPPPPTPDWQGRALTAEDKLRRIRSIAT